ncbi:MAG: antibiotic biosynthesis monooxygenase [Syntrophaceae bacterium]|nr:antibiotic biosynthesis monooxygenase [Syntrophaceae bacterium]
MALAFLFAASIPAFAGDAKTLTVLAIVYVKPGFEAQVRQELLKLVPLTHREPGCINYDMHVGVGTNPDDYMKENPRLYMFYENWRSREDWDLHMKMPYLKAWFDMAPRVTEKIELTIWERVKLPTNPTFRGGKNPDPKEQYTLLALVDVKEKCDPPLDKVNCPDRAWKEMMSLVPLTHTEEGCINYEMHVNLDMNTMAKNPKKIMFYENWYNFKVWKVDHMGAGYLVRWFDMAPKLTTSINLTGWKMIHFKETPAP